MVLRRTSAFRKLRSARSARTMEGCATSRTRRRRRATAVAGGVLRDVLSAEIPLILRRDIYATAAIVGAVTYLAARALQLSEPTTVVSGVTVVVALRLGAIVWGWRLPVIASPEQTKDRP